MQDKPRTPPETLHRARQIALDAGLQYVYEGNIKTDAGNTICPGCKHLLVRRGWHDVLQNRVRDGHCPDCGTAIPGRWTNPRAARAPAATIGTGTIGDRYADWNF
jgi:pyruvate formate lyase activating enzyme